MADQTARIGLHAVAIKEHLKREMPLERRVELMRRQIWAMEGFIEGLGEHMRRQSQISNEAAAQLEKAEAIYSKVLAIKTTTKN